MYLTFNLLVLEIAATIVGGSLQVKSRGCGELTPLIPHKFEQTIWGLQVSDYFLNIGAAMAAHPSRPCSLRAQSRSREVQSPQSSSKNPVAAVAAHVETVKQLEFEPLNRTMPLCEHYQRSPSIQNRCYYAGRGFYA